MKWKTFLGCNMCGRKECKGLEDCIQHRFRGRIQTGGTTPFSSNTPKGVVGKALEAAIGNVRIGELEKFPKKRKICNLAWLQQLYIEINAVPSGNDYLEAECIESCLPPDPPTRVRREVKVTGTLNGDRFVFPWLLVGGVYYVALNKRTNSAMKIRIVVDERVDSFSFVEYKNGVFVFHSPEHTENLAVFTSYIRGENDRVRLLSTELGERGRVRVRVTDPTGNDEINELVG